MNTDTPKNIGDIINNNKKWSNESMQLHNNKHQETLTQQQMTHDDMWLTYKATDNTEMTNKNKGLMQRNINKKDTQWHITDEWIKANVLQVT